VVRESQEEVATHGVVDLIPAGFETDTKKQIIGPGIDTGSYP
jgi:hypothetical protein